MREVKAKQLPELDDELAEEAGFDTLDELREDIRSRMAEAETSADRGASSARPRWTPRSPRRRSRCPDALIEARAREMWDSMLHQLSHQGIDRETYLRISGRTEEDTIEQAKPDAEQALRREAVLAAVAEAESLEPTEDEMLEAVAEAAPPARRPRPRSCSSGCAPTGAWTASRTICRSARRWTCWRSPRSRFRSPSSQIPDAADSSRSWSNDPGLAEPGPLLVFARVVRHGPSAI